MNTIVGDFIKESALPFNFDCILFCRVLWDWSIDKNSKLLKMAFEALNPNGYVLICEAFKEDNARFAFAWEFRYIFWDAFEPAVFKSSDEYVKLLSEIGFKNISKLSYENESFSVIIAQKT